MMKKFTLTVPLRKALLALALLLTTATAWAQEPIPGGAGEDSAVSLESLPRDLSQLAGGWYKVESNLGIGPLTFHGDTHLVIAGGDTLTIIGQDYGFLAADNASPALTISGEGTLVIHSTIGGIYGFSSYTQTGCNVTTNGGIYATEEVTIIGGQVNVYGDITCLNGNITLGWTNPTDYIFTSDGFSVPKGSVVIADDKKLTDGSNIYDHQTPSNDLKNRGGATLRPYCFSVTFNTSGNILYFISLQEALNVAYTPDEDATVTLLADIDLGNDSINFVGDENSTTTVTLDMNHHSITGAHDDVDKKEPDDDYLFVVETGNLNIINGRITNNGTSSVIENRGNLSLSNVTISGYTSGLFITDDKSHTTLANCIITGCEIGILVDYIGGAPSLAFAGNTTIEECSLAGIMVNADEGAHISGLPAFGTGDEKNAYDIAYPPYDPNQWLTFENATYATPATPITVTFFEINDYESDGSIQNVAFDPINNPDEHLPFIKGYDKVKDDNDQPIPLDQLFAPTSTDYLLFLDSDSVVIKNGMPVVTQIIGYGGFSSIGEDAFVIPSGQDTLITIEADSGFVIAQVVVNGTPVPNAFGQTTLDINPTFTDLQNTVIATFARDDAWYLDPFVRNKFEANYYNCDITATGTMSSAVDEDKRFIAFGTSADDTSAGIAWFDLDELTNDIGKHTYAMVNTGPHDGEWSRSIAALPSFDAFITGNLGTNPVVVCPYDNNESSYTVPNDIQNLDLYPIAVSSDGTTLYGVDHENHRLYSFSIDNIGDKVVALHDNSYCDLEIGSEITAIGVGSFDDDNGDPKDIVYLAMVSYNGDPSLWMYDVATRTLTKTAAPFNIDAYQLYVTGMDVGTPHLVVAGGPEIFIYDLAEDGTLLTPEPFVQIPANALAYSDEGAWFAAAPLADETRLVLANTTANGKMGIAVIERKPEQLIVRSTFDQGANYEEHMVGFDTGCDITFDCPAGEVFINVEVNGVPQQIEWDATSYTFHADRLEGHVYIDMQTSPPTYTIDWTGSQNVYVYHYYDDTIYKWDQSEGGTCALVLGGTVLTFCPTEGNVINSVLVNGVETPIDLSNYPIDVTGFKSDKSEHNLPYMYTSVTNGNFFYVKPNDDVSLVVNAGPIALPKDGIDNAQTVQAYAGHLDANNQQVAYNVALAGRTLYKDNDWNTLCLPFNVSDFSGTPLEGAEVMELDTEGKYTDAGVLDATNGTLQTGYDANEGTLCLFFKQATSITAGQPYLVRWAGDGSQNIVNPVFSNTLLVAGTPAAVSVGSGADQLQFVANYDALTIPAATPEGSIVFLGTGSQLYYPDGTGDVSIQAFTAYFRLGDGSSPAPIYRTVIGFGDDATSVIAIDNGQLIIDNEAGAWYDLSGRRLDTNTPAKGIYIHNGKKIVIK